MLIEKGLVVAEVCEKDATRLISDNPGTPLVAVMTTSTERFWGVCNSFEWKVRERRIFVRISPPNSKDEPRVMNRNIFVHSPGTSSWKIGDCLPELVRIIGPNTKGTLVAIDTMKYEPKTKRAFETPLSQEEAIEQAEFLVGKPHFIVHGVSAARLDFDGVHGRVQVLRSMAFIGVKFEGEFEFARRNARIVPGGIDINENGFLERTSFAVRNGNDLFGEFGIEASIMEDVRMVEDGGDCDWVSGLPLVRPIRREDILQKIIRAPHQAIRRLVS